MPMIAHLAANSAILAALNLVSPPNQNNKSRQGQTDPSGEE
jgi:hypothetical protein